MDKRHFSTWRYLTLLPNPTRSLPWHPASLSMSDRRREPMSRELSRLKMAHSLPSSSVPQVAWKDLHPSSTTDWPWCYLRRDSNLFHQWWDGCDASCHSPSCDHPYCASEDQDQVRMSSHDSQSPPTWPPTNQVWPYTKLIQVYWLIAYWTWCWTLCTVLFTLCITCTMQ